MGLSLVLLLPFLLLVTMDSTTKLGRPKGSKDGPRRPGAPPRGRPKISAEQSEPEGEPNKNASFVMA